jgi:alkanesulfonate monooxygenase SsuD/methylene tetrahydromethanopterin reductase-like flavin-dependent oxidoreductase (luciferase family)
MDAWYQCENPYPFVPQDILDRADSVRASLPNKYCDPRIAADLFEEVLDEFLLCDDHGLNVVAIEHHAGINSLFGANPLILGILARQTRNVRILSMGTLISLRQDPVRVAEEYATADVISRGRLEIGFVKSGGTEMASNNANPINNVERYWEAIDLIRKALTHQEGPFSWEGKHYTHRHVNIWPRPWQAPHPRLWAATGDPDTASEVGRRGMINVLVLRGAEGTRRAWAAYRQARVDAGLPAVNSDHFAYAAFVYVGDTHEEGVRVGSKLLWFLNTSLKSAPQYSRFLPGTVPPQSAPQVYRTAPTPSAHTGGSVGDTATPPANAAKSAASAGQNAATLIGMTAEQATERGILFVGNPDTVYRQIMDFYDKVGGFGHLVMVGRTGFMTHAEAEKGIKLFSKEVLPRLREIAPVTVE